MANITNFLTKIKTAVHGKDVRGAIHDAIKQVYDDASVDHDNANMEVKLARGTHNTLNDRLDNVDEIQAQTNAQLSHKANEVDLITERKRIDSLTKLNDGSTTGDAELIDGRIGCDGITYSNIGSAIRTQIDKLKDSLLMESITFDLDGYINHLGKDESLSGWKKTNYIKVNKGDVAQVNAQGYKTNVSVIHFYNLNQKAIQSLQIGNDEEQTFTQVIPEDGYVRFSGKQSERLHANISRNNLATVDIASRFNSEFNLGIDYSWTDGSYVNHQNGNLASYEGYSYSDYINVSNLNGAYVYLTEYYQYIGGIAFTMKTRNISAELD